MSKLRFVRASYFIWLAVPIGIYGAFLIWGLPHLLWSYDWTPTGPDSRSDFFQRHYTRCTYVGPYGPMTIRPDDGTCGIVRFAKLPEA